MRLDKHGDVISSSCGRYIVAIDIAEKALAANFARARRTTRERMAARDKGTLPAFDAREGQERGLFL